MKIAIFLIGLMLTSPLQALVPLIRGDAPFNEAETITIRRVVGMTHPYRPYTPEELETPAIAGLLREEPDAVDTYIRQELRRLLPERPDIKVRVIPTAIWELFALHEALVQGRLGKIKIDAWKTVGKRDFSFEDFLNLSEILWPLLPSELTPAACESFVTTVLAPQLAIPIPAVSQINTLLPDPAIAQFYIRKLSNAKQEIVDDIRQGADSLILAVLQAELRAMQQNRVLMLRLTKGITATREGSKRSLLLDYPLPLREHGSLEQEMRTLASNIQTQNPKLVEEQGPERLEVRGLSLGATLFGGFIHDGLNVDEGGVPACVWWFVHDKKGLFYSLSLSRQDLLGWGDFFNRVSPDWESLFNGCGETFHPQFPSCWFTRDPDFFVRMIRDARRFPNLPALDATLPLPKIISNPERQKGAEKILQYTEAIARLLAMRTEIISIGPHLVSRNSAAADQAGQILKEQREAHGAFRHMLAIAAEHHLH